MLTTILLLAAVGTVPAEQSIAVRRAAFLEALRVARNDHHPWSSGQYCLAMEGGIDPPVEMIAYLRKASRVAVFGQSECAEEGLLIREPFTLHGYANVIGINALRLERRTRALVDMSILGGDGTVAVVETRTGWKGTCCRGGIVGDAQKHVGRRTTRCS
jgi:hypothetical protein